MTGVRPEVRAHFEAEETRRAMRAQRKLARFQRMNQMLGQAGLPGLEGTGALGESPRLRGIKNLEQAFGGMSPAGVAKILERSLSPTARIDRDIGFLQQIQGLIDTREMIPGLDGARTITPRSNRVEDMIGGLQRDKGIINQPGRAQFGADLGTGIQRSLESALRTAFTGGSAREITEQFGRMLGESVIESLTKGIAESLIQRSGFQEQLLDIMLGLGSSEAP